MIIYELEKTSAEKIVISIDDFRGHRLINIRIHEDFQDGKGYRPTKKGVAVNVNLAPELHKGLDKLFSEIERETEKAA